MSLHHPSKFISKDFDFISFFNLLDDLGPEVFLLGIDTITFIVNPNEYLVFKFNQLDRQLG